MRDALKRFAESEMKIIMNELAEEKEKNISQSCIEKSKSRTPPKSGEFRLFFVTEGIRENPQNDISTYANYSHIGLSSLTSGQRRWFFLEVSCFYGEC